VSRAVSGEAEAKGMMGNTNGDRTESDSCQSALCPTCWVHTGADPWAGVQVAGGRARRGTWPPLFGIRDTIWMSPYFWTFIRLITCAHDESRYCFWRRLSVRLSVRTKSRKLLIRYWCNLVGICPMANDRSDSKLVTFDLDFWPWELFVLFQFRLGLATSFSV